MITILSGTNFDRLLTPTFFTEDKVQSLNLKVKIVSKLRSHIQKGMAETITVTSLMRVLC